MGWTSVQLGKIERIGARRARAAVQGVLDDERPDDVATSIQLEDVGEGLDVVLADPSAAEPACSDRRPATVPAVHPLTPPLGGLMLPRSLHVR